MIQYCQSRSMRQNALYTKQKRRKSVVTASEPNVLNSTVSVLLLQESVKAAVAKGVLTAQNLKI